jgi:tetratricopeptide (TPR) repeat protein
VFAHLSEEGRLFDESGGWRDDLSIDELEVPEGIRLVVGRRIQRLDEVAQRVLTVAAAVGRDFDFSFLEALEEFDPDALLDAVESAERSGLLVPSEGTRFSFAHELIRQTLLASVSLPRRNRIHLRIGETLAKLHASDLEAHAAEIAAHFMQAGAADTARTIDLLMLAGNRAIEAAAFDEALRYFEDALSLEPEDLATKADLLYGVGLAQRAVQRLDEGVDTWRRALELYEELGDVSREVTVIVDIANQLAWAGRWEETVELAMRGLHLIGEGMTEERGRLLCLTGIAMGGAGLYDSGMQLSDEALGIAEALDDDVLRSLALATKTIVYWGFCKFDEAIAAAERAEPMLEGTAEVWSLVNLIGFKVWSLGTLGRIEEALAEMPRLTQLAEKVGHAGGLLIAVRTRSMVGAFRDRDEQLAWAWEDFRLNEENGLPWTAQSQYGIGRALLGGGEVDDAMERMRIGMETDPPGITWGYALGFYFRSLALIGRRREAEDMIGRIRAEFPDTDEPMTVGRVGLLRLFVEGLFELGLDAPELRAPIAAAALSGVKLDFMGSPIEMFSGLAAALAGDRAGAYEQLDRAADYCRSLDKLAEYAVCRRFRGVVAARAGDTASAREPLTEAAEIFGRQGFVFYEALCRDQLASLNP